MPRSTIANRVGKIFDKSLELYDLNTAAIAATTNGASVFFDCAKYLEFDVAINAAAFSGFVAGTALWSVAIQACATLGGTYQTVGTIDLNGAAAQRFIALSGAQVNGAVPGAQYLRVVATKTGTPGNLQFGAFLAHTGD